MLLYIEYSFIYSKCFEILIKLEPSSPFSIPLLIVPHVSECVCV